MADTGHDAGAGESRTKRVGFWLGLILFVAILALPTPASMRQAARDKFGPAILQDAAQRAAQIQSAVPEPAEASGEGASEALHIAERQAVEVRARAMLAAAAVTALVACWWITVAVPIPVTSMLPLVLFPLVGVMPIRHAATPYANSNVFLFMGGFMIALAIERWGLHRRIALQIVRLVGSGQATIVLGFMVASAFLSMWISNTATTLMMLPIGLAIVSAVRGFSETKDAAHHGHFSAALMLGIAYAASVGGIATPIGTPPNISFRGQIDRLFPDAPEISFAQWMIIFLPLVIVFVPVIWIVLVKVTCPIAGRGPTLARDTIRTQLRELGPMRGPERRVLAVFLVTAVLWMTRSVPLGQTDHGWASWLERWSGAAAEAPFPFHAAFVNDATVALFMAVLLFMIPAQRDASGRREYLMDWPTALRLPWGILLLFGGGFSIAAGFSESGLSLWCGRAFAALGLQHPVVVVIATCLLMTFLTEVTSNTATTQVMLPILARVSQSMGVSPLMLMLPATVSASCAFMMPVATPPNAIVFGSGHVEMGRMVKSGLIINFIGVALVTATFYFVVVPVLGIDPSVMPSWAQ
jgi:sodium-dependent dicarboxylate transporter 2/3/5